MAWFYLILVIILTNISQVLLKKSIGEIDLRNFRLKGSDKRTLLTLTIGAILLLIAPILYITALKDIPLNVAFSFTSVNVIIVQFTGYKYFNEEITIDKLAGAIMILIGLIVYNF